MCGLAGIIGGGFDPAGLGPMADAIAHRGPDGRGFLLYRAGAEPSFGRSPAQAAARLEGATAGFAHLRLSIIDLREINDQPLRDESGQLALSFNGEIYNYLELREELEGLGHRFRTSGDTEVLLAAYAEWGESCVERLVGMWAFALLDARSNTVLLSRDRFGIKPLYWTLRDGRLLFASEIKSLLAAPGPPPRPNEAAVRRYMLTGGVDESEQTFFEGIFSLPAAHQATIAIVDDPAPLRPERYWQIPPEGYEGGIHQAGAEFRQRLEESVAIHARSDVPVGTCLSGGLDSSSIVCVAEQLRGAGRIPHYAHSGFGYVPDDAEYSERSHMEEVVRKTSIEMTYIEVGDERFRSALGLVARQQDEPFGTTSIAAQHFVFEAAKAEGIKVMLDGQGADEILVGYHHYFPLIGMAQLRGRHLIRYGRFARAYRRRFGARLLSARQVAAMLAPKPLSRRAAARLAVPPSARLLAPALRERVEPGDYATPYFDSPHDLLAAQTTSLGLPALLRYEDRNSMAHSIEARVPFLDHRLVELCFRLPLEYKLDGMVTKAVLREAMRDVLPEPIRTRSDKIGFRAEPGATWALAEAHRGALAENRTELERSWLDEGEVRSLLTGSDRSTEAEFLLWRVINLKLWARSFWGEPGEEL